MRIFRIAKKEFLRNLRDPSIMLIFTLIPIFAISLLGIAVPNQFSDSEIVMSDIKIEYCVLGEASEFTDSFVKITNHVMGSSSELLRVEAQEESITRLKNNDIAAYILINEEDHAIRLYKNPLYSEKAIILEGVLNSFVERYNIFYEVQSTNAYSMTEIDFGNVEKSFVSLEELERKEGPSSMDYYGIALTILFIFYGLTTALTNTMDDKKNGTIARVFLTPIAKRELLIGKVIGEVGISTIQMAIVIASTILFYNVNWGTNPLYAFFLIFTQIILSVSIGIVLGLLFNREEAVIAVVHILIVVFAFFGGSYMPLDGLGMLGEVGKYFSPIWWSMTGIFSWIYTKETAYFSIVILHNVGFSILFLWIAALKIRKKENFIYG